MISWENMMIDSNSTEQGAPFCCHDISQRQHNALETAESYMRAIVLIVIVVFSSVGNGSLILSVVKQEKLRTVTNVLVISQCTSDLALTLVCVIPRASTAMSRDWYLGCEFCVLYDTLLRSFVTISMVHLAILSLDRFLLIVRHMHSRWITKRVVIILIPFIWLAGVLFYQPWLASRTSNRALFSFQGDMCFYLYNASDDRTSTLVSAVLFSLAWLVPLFVQLFCFYGIIQDLRTCKRKVRPLFSSTWYQIAARAYAKSAYTILCVIALFVVFSAPFSLVLFLRYVRPDVTHYGYTYTELIMFVSIAVKPYVYIARSKQCRNPLTFCFRTKSHTSFPMEVSQVPLQKVRPSRQRRKTLPYIIGKENDFSEAAGPIRDTEFYAVFSVKPVT